MARVARDSITQWLSCTSCRIFPLSRPDQNLPAIQATLTATCLRAAHADTCCQSPSTASFQRVTLLVPSDTASTLPITDQLTRQTGPSKAGRAMFFHPPAGSSCQSKTLHCPAEGMLMCANHETQSQSNLCCTTRQADSEISHVSQVQL